jgi:hypothetical protein
MSGQSADFTEFSKFYMENVPRLVTFLVCEGVSVSDAADCVQETLIDALPPVDTAARASPHVAGYHRKAGMPAHPPSSDAAPPTDSARRGGSGNQGGRPPDRSGRARS